MNNFDPRECIFYQIYPIGFCDAPYINEKAPATDRLIKIEKWIPHMKSIGINALYLGPVFESGRHGYDTHDYTLIDSRLGTNDDFLRLCKALKEADIRLVLDGVFNHVGRGFFAVEDVLRNRENSPYCNWISGLRFDRNNSFGDKLFYDSWAGHEMLVKLNLRNPDVKEHLLKAVDMWIDVFGIDGLRLDAADCIDPDFFCELRARTKKKKPDFWLMGEITDSDNYCQWVNPRMLDSVTNYECYTLFYTAIKSKDLNIVAKGLKRQFGAEGIYKDLTLYTFLDNHDVNRIVHMIKHKKNLKNLYTLMYTVPGAPSVYYGSEWGQKGKKEPRNDKPLRPAIDPDCPEITDRGLMEHLKNLAQIRQSSHALKFGSYEEILVQNEAMVFARKSKEETKLVFINIADTEKVMSVDYLGKHFELTVPAFLSKIISC